MSCHFLFTHAENACVLRTIDNPFTRAVWANTRFISSIQGKNSMLSVAFLIGKFL